MITLSKKKSCRKTVLSIVVATIILLTSGSALANPWSGGGDTTPHKPAYVQTIDDLVKVQAEPKNSPVHPTVPATTDIDIIQLIQQLDETLILGYLQNLTAFGPRETGTESCDQAARYIYHTFQDMGLTVNYRNYTDPTVSGSNIEATIYGRNEADIFIICGHYDSVAAGPGADDDGSGVAAVLAAAHLMSPYAFNNTVRFIAFSGEEQGLIGSYHYAEDAYNNNQSIVAVFNVDMIGYTSTGPDGHLGKIFENTASEWIVTFTQYISQLYNEYIGIEPLPQGEHWGSDHYYFWEFGYDAVFYHEYYFNDYYHSAGDTIEHMNLTYSAHFSRLILATLATMAQEPRPVLEIRNITGGMGVSCQIINIGDTKALEVNATVKITGGIFKRVNIDNTSSIEQLAMLQVFPVHTKPFGLGRITIVITAVASNADQVTKQASAFALGPFVLKVTPIP
jgi:aminopeptidase YwaD